MSRRVYIETYGCQMNVADSELMGGILAGRGYVAVDDEKDADVILINTCAIREKAEDRIYGRLGWLKPLKDKRPDLVLGVAGCMAEHMREKLIARAPYVDVVVGPDAYRRLPELIEGASKSDPMIDVRLDRSELYEGVEVARQPGLSGWITIMRGCDKFCTFCIVPYVRGRERSVPPDELVRQARQMVAMGFKEVTLLGQTVTSYEVDGCDFASLLERMCAVEGIERVRYTSPYPNDFDDRLLDTLGRLPKIGRHIHLPVQSGSTRVLADMRRGYTREGFLGLVRRIRARLPKFSLSTDIIVGYPGETDDEFEQTMTLAKIIGFDSAFMFKYSERPGTAASRSRPDNVPEAVKSARLTRLIDQQREMSAARSQAMVGQDVQVLVGGPNPRNPDRMMGRTSCFKTTVLEGEHAVGDLVTARVRSATTHTLFAQPLS